MYIFIIISEYIDNYVILFYMAYCPIHLNLGYLWSWTKISDKVAYRQRDGNHCRMLFWPLLTFIT